MDLDGVKKLLGPVMAKARAYRTKGTDLPTAVASGDHSPEPFGPFKLISGEPGGAGPQLRADNFSRHDVAKLLLDVMPDMARSLIGIFRSAQTMSHNPAKPMRHISPATLREAERKAKAWGADLIGYTEIDPDDVFAGRRVLDKNVIVLAMEMDQVHMSRAPHLDAFGEVHHVYADLGLAAFKVAKFLRRRGFAAEAGPALGGDAVYPPLAQRAGIGWVGHNGILLTERFGPRVRLAVVYCSIDNLPFFDANDRRLAWMRSFCDMCKACVRRCPPRALMDEPTERANGALTYVDNEKCFPFFEANYGCGVCIKVCPFSHIDADRLRHAYEHHRHDAAQKQHLETLMHTPELVKLGKGPKRG